MNKLYEIASLIPKGIANIDKVIEGTYNSIKLEMGTISDEEAKEIARRRAICSSCIFNSVNAKKEGFKTRRAKPFCTQCGCPITTKTASLSSNCGLEEFNKNNPNTPMPLAWTAYGKQDSV